MPPAPKALFWTILVVAFLVWIGAVYLYLQGASSPWQWQDRNLRRTPTTPSPPQFNPAVDNWQEFRSEKYGFLFRHPDWINVKETTGTNDSSDFLPFIANWFLLDQQRTKLLVAIFLTNLTIEEIQQRFPDISLTPYLNGNLPGGYARPFVGQNMYILSKSDNQNFLINGHFTDFKETLGEDATAKLIEEIVGSIKLI